MDIEKIIDSLSLEELVGQTMCLYVNASKANLEEFEEQIKRMQPGGIFIGSSKDDEAKQFVDTANKYLKVPVVLASDIECGPHWPLNGTGTLPLQMAVGAANDPELTEKAWEQVAQICRKGGFHWGFNPVVDINFNFRSPECNTRSYSDDPNHVIKMASATIKGYRKNGMQACTLKHFPGQGVDERNSHFVTTVNTLSKRKWMKTYGKVYKEMFKLGADSVMIGHIALPSFQTEKDEMGYLPATVSKSLITDLLKGKLGFKGVVISDAITMVGVATRYPINDLPLHFLNAGGDMVLFPHQEGCDKVIGAVKDGKLSIERIKDAVRRILKLKDNIHLFEPDYFKDLQVTGNLSEISQELAEKSITKIRDVDNILPVKLEKGSKILLANIVQPFFNKSPKGDEFLPLESELKALGMEVKSTYMPDYKEIEKIKNDYGMIMINSILSSDNYDGGSLRFDWSSVMTFWDGYILDHPKVVFTSFGDPYKLFDASYVRTYINAYSAFTETQIAVARAVLGVVPFKGKSPVSFNGYFERRT